MLEPVATEHIMAAAIAGAMVVLFGAVYALFYALARLQRSRYYLLCAAIGYGALCVAVAVLARTLNMNGFWQAVAVTMLVGYLIAPHIIWRLCVGTHASERLLLSGDES